MLCSGVGGCVLTATGKPCFLVCDDGWVLRSRKWALFMIK